MKPTTMAAIALILVGVVATWWPTADSGPSPPAPASDALRAAVGPVAQKLAGHQEDGQRLAAFYLALADVIARDQGKVISTTSQVRELNQRAGLLMFQRTAIAGKYPGLAEAVDKVLEDAIGLDNVTLDTAKQKAAIDALGAIAWACGGNHG